MKYIMIPAEILSKKLYIPKTMAPDSLLLPTTSEIKLIPVVNIKDWENPMKMAIAYIQLPFCLSKRKSKPSEIKERKVPKMRVFFLPILMQKEDILALRTLDEKQMMRGTKATEKGMVFDVVPLV